MARYLEDFWLGLLKAFAVRFDPQAFHRYEEAARRRQGLAHGGPYDARHGRGPP